MSDCQRSIALEAWHKLSLRPSSKDNAEQHYNDLLRSADAMEQARIINSDEWRRLVQQAGASLALHADKLTGKGWI